VPLNESFIDRASATIARLASNPLTRQELGRAALRAGIELNEAHMEGQRALARRLMGLTGIASL
jgi:hypothetical protein